MKKCIATRKEICAGILIIKEDEELIEKRIKEEKSHKFFLTDNSVCRGMLFNVNEDGLANDLIYTTPTNYPIDGIEPKFEVESDFIIKLYAELDELLKYMGFGIDLTQSDLNQIYRKLIAHCYWIWHHADELLGWKELRPKKADRYTDYESSEIQMNLMDVFANIYMIGRFRKGVPHPEEPRYGLIKKRR